VMGLWKVHIEDSKKKRELLRGYWNDQLAYRNSLRNLR